MTSGLLAGHEAAEMPPCPYCGKAMRWTPLRGLTRGVFECEKCGDFPDYRTAFQDDPRARGETGQSTADSPEPARPHWHTST
jgi:hypothetical protein